MRAMVVGAILVTMHANLCEGAAPSSSVVNLTTGGSAFAADQSGAIFLTGVASTSGPLPVTSGAAQAQAGGGTCLTVSGPPAALPCPDAFIAKVQAGTGALIYATYLGGDKSDIGTGIAVDGSGNAYVT